MNTAKQLHYKLSEGGKGERGALKAWHWSKDGIWAHTFNTKFSLSMSLSLSLSLSQTHTHTLSLRFLVTKSLPLLWVGVLLSLSLSLILFYSLSVSLYLSPSFLSLTLLFFLYYIPSMSSHSNLNTHRKKGSEGYRYYSLTFAAKLYGCVRDIVRDGGRE